MPRANRRKVDPEASEVQLLGTVGERRESYHGEQYVVRSVTGTGAAKTYRCQGCDQEIRAGVPHVVAWPEHADADERRHWHTGCWRARERRTPGVQRTRSAPRY